MRIFAILIFLFASTLHAQDYFQQDVAYTINVALDDENHFLNGDISFEYTNNAPEALDFLWIHVWPNAYKNGKTALAKQQYRTGKKYMFYALEKKLGYIDSLDFKVNAASAKWEFHPEHIDIVKLNLSSPLQPGQTITVSTPFKIKLPSGSISRLGHIDQSYQITQWYPKPAVFDKDGWHEMPYLNQGEFYSEYGSFDVYLTLPKNYVVGATGDLVNCAFEEAFMDSLAQVDIDFESEGSNDFPASSSETKTLHFHQENVHDFAWFADKRWHVRKGQVELPHSGRKVTSWALFTPKNKEEWERGVEYINDGTFYYSKWNGDYPYNHVTAVDGTISAGGGMEYPNVTVIGNTGSDMGLETVIVHEVGHNWFYGILGSNERTNAWMDEGINSFNETRYFETKYEDTLSFVGDALNPNLAAKFDLDGYSYRYRDELMWLLSARRPDDQPMQCHSDEFTSLNYGAVVYKKTAVAFDYLKGAIDGLKGEGTFDGAMQAYFDEWKFRHPGPADLQNVLERETGEKLDWFFEELVTTTGRPNYKVKSVKKTDAGYEVKVKNKGDIPGPFSLNGLADGDLKTTQWYPGVASESATKVTLSAQEIDAIQIDTKENMIEYDRKDNQIKTKGLLKRVEPLQVRMLTRIEDPERSQLFWMPVLAWNEQNNMMAGINLHNTTLPMRNWEWSITPMYAFGSKTLTGFGRLSYYSGGLEGHLQARTFRSKDHVHYTEDYYRTSLELGYTFDKRPNSGWSSKLTAEVAYVYEDQRLDKDVLGEIVFLSDSRNRLSSKLLYTIFHDRAFSNHSLAVEGRLFSNEFTSEFIHFAAEYEGSVQYNQDGKRLRWRLYGGANDRGYFWPIGGNGFTGNFDIMYEHLFLQRQFSNTFLLRQVSNTQGGIHIPIVSYNWMTTAKIELEIPRIPFLTIWGAGAVYDDPFNLTPAPITRGVYNAGVSLVLLRDILAVHIPLANEQILQGKYNPQDYITFELKLEQLNIWRMLRQIEL